MLVSFPNPIVDNLGPVFDCVSTGLLSLFVRWEKLKNVDDLGVRVVPVASQEPYRIRF